MTELRCYMIILAEITDGVVPELQRLGVVRTAYEHRHFRDNLLAF